VKRLNVEPVKLMTRIPLWLTACSARLDPRLDHE
jgi:hypothetical protein